MKHLISVLILLVGVIAFASAQKIKVDLDKTVDLSKYKTYSWAKGIEARNPIVNQMIKDGVERELTAKGFVKVESGADIAVLFWVATDASLQISNPSWSNSMGIGATTGIAGS